MPSVAFDAFPSSPIRRNTVEMIEKDKNVNLSIVKIYRLISKMGCT